MEHLGKRVKKLRNKIKLSQEELSTLIGIERVSLSKSENNKREFTISELANLSKVFNMSLDQLVNPEYEPDIVVLQNRITEKKTPPAVRISVPQKNIDKFKQVLLYILNKVGAKSNIGQTVIYKLLYFIDFNYYEKYEEQLMGANYIKNYHGPTPIEFMKITEQMIKDNEIEMFKSKHFDYHQTKYIPRINADLTYFSGRELDIINSVIEKLSDMNAKQISDYSHGDVPWLVTEEQKPIEYESVFFRTPQYSVRDDYEWFYY